MTTSTAFRPREELRGLDHEVMDDDDLLDLDPESTCPRCGHIGYAYDPECRAWIHDYCGLYVESESKWSV